MAVGQRYRANPDAAFPETLRETLRRLLAAAVGIGIEGHVDGSGTVAQLPELTCIEMGSQRTGDVLKPGLPQHGIVEQALDEDDFRMRSGLRPAVQAASIPAESGEAVPTSRGCGRRGCPPTERQSDARMRRSPRRLPNRPDAELPRSDPTESANRAGNRQAHNRCACVRSVPESGFRVDTDRQRPRYDDVTARRRNVLLPAAEARRRAIGAATPELE